MADYKNARGKKFGLGVRTEMVWADNMVEGHGSVPSVAGKIANAVRVITLPGNSSWVYFTVKLPKQYNNGDFRSRVYWAPDNTDVNGFALTSQYFFHEDGTDLSDEGLFIPSYSWFNQFPNGTANDLHITNWSDWVTPTGATDENRILMIRVGRPTGTFTGGIQIAGCEFQYTIDKLTDD